MTLKIRCFRKSETGIIQSPKVIHDQGEPSKTPIYSIIPNMKIATFCSATLSILLPILAQAQTATDDIKEGTILTQAGIKMKGFGTRLLPLPAGDWEVVARSDEEIKLSNKGTDYVAPAPKVVLTLVNKDTSANLVAAVISYSPEVVRIRWGGNTCDAPKAALVDTLGTTTGSLDFACVTAYYNKSGFKKTILNSATSTNGWTKKYLSALIPKADGFPDANVWMSISANRDSGRTYGITYFARSSTDLVVGDAFDQAIRAWASATGKSIVAALNGGSETIGPFPTAPQ